MEILETQKDSLRTCTAVLAGGENQNSLKINDPDFLIDQHECYFVYPKPERVTAASSPAVHKHMGNDRSQSFISKYFFSLQILG